MKAIRRILVALACVACVGCSEKNPPIVEESNNVYMFTDVLPPSEGWEYSCYEIVECHSETIPYYDESGRVLLDSIVYCYVTIQLNDSVTESFGFDYQCEGNDSLYNEILEADSLCVPNGIGLFE